MKNIQLQAKHIVKQILNGCFIKEMTTHIKHLTAPFILRLIADFNKRNKIFALVKPAEHTHGLKCIIRARLIGGFYNNACLAHRKTIFFFIKACVGIDFNGRIFAADIFNERQIDLRINGSALFKLKEAPFFLNLCRFWYKIQHKFSPEPKLIYLCRWRAK